MVMRLMSKFGREEKRIRLLADLAIASEVTKDTVYNVVTYKELHNIVRGIIDITQTMPLDNSVIFNFYVLSFTLGKYCESDPESCFKVYETDLQSIQLWAIKHIPPSCDCPLDNCKCL